MVMGVDTADGSLCACSAVRKRVSKWSRPASEPRPMRRCFDHVDLRVRSLTEARPFYEVLLPALGFTRDVKIEGWLEYEAEGADGAQEFFGITESPEHVGNECRIAFCADSIRDVDRLAAIAVNAGARNVEGPEYYTGLDYYAVFFEDPSGNRLEICHRERRE
jgi:predicted enzyme related to lactoylglutathione lyase